MSELFGHLLAYQQTDAFKADVKAYKDAHQPDREKMREASRKYRQQHPDHVAMRDAASKHRATLIESQQGKCYLCGKALKQDIEVDHVIPLSKGGTNDLANLRVAHRHCNRRKGNKMPVQLQLMMF